MSKKLRVLALVLVAIFALSVFAGCGKDKETQGTSSVSTESEIAGTNSDDPTEENPGEQDGDKDPGDTSSTVSGGAINPNKPGLKIDCNPTGWPIVNKKITFEIQGQISPSRGDPEKMSHFKYYEQLTNIKTKYIGVVETKETERVTLALQSGNMPDAFTSYGWSDVMLQKYTSGKKPALVNVKDLLPTYGPEMQKLLDSDPVTMGLNLTADGKIFTMPKAPNVVDNYDHWLNVNTVWLENVGLDIPTTADEFEDMLLAFRDENPDGDGIDGNHWPFAQWNWGGNFIMSMWGPQTTSGSIGIDLDGTVYYPYATKNAREAATFWNRIRNTAGIMDNSVVNKPDGSWKVFTEFIAKGNIGCFHWSYLQSERFDPELLKDYVAIPFPTANYKNDSLRLSKSANPFNNTPSRGSIVITSSCENVPAMIRYFDYYMTADGLMLGNWGTPVNGNYRKNKDGTYTITNKDLLDNEAAYQDAMGWNMSISETKKAIPHLLKVDKTDKNYKNGVYDKYNAAAIKTYQNAHKKNPVVYMANYAKTAEEIAQLRKYTTFTGQSGSMGSYVTGHWKIGDFDTKVENWNKADLKGYLKIYQGIVNRNKANLIYSDKYANRFAK